MYSFVVGNIHCGACKDDITEVVHAIDPSAEVTVDIERGIVQIKAAKQFDLSQAVRKLHSRGFDVNIPSVKSPQNHRVSFSSSLNSGGANGVSQLAPPGGVSTNGSGTNGPGTNGSSSAIPSTEPPTEEERGQTHASICKDCKTNAVRAVFAISGMTCASCAASITAAVRASLPDVLDVSVDAIQGSAYILLRSRDLVPQAKEAIEDSGFDAEVVEVLPLNEEGVKEYKLEASIGGMTCASCSSNVKQSLESLTHVIQANVDAVDGKAEIITDTNSSQLKTDIKNSVEDLGYDCEIPTDFTEVHSAQSKPRARTVTLEVHGIFCERCPKRIMDALRNYGDAVDILDPVSVNVPFVKFTYLPSPPKLTIREILHELKESNQGLEFNIVRPQSLEEIAAENQIKEKNKISRRLKLSSALVIPATVTMLVPSFMMSKAGEWLMLVLATIAYFFVADMFHKKALKELKQVVKSQRPLGYRLLHFGSMNLLMSSGTSISYFASVVAMAIDAGETYFDSVVFLTFFLLVGRYLDIYSKIKTTSAVSLISRGRPEEVQLASTKETINIDLCEVGDRVLVHPGQRCAVDGVVISKHSGGEFDESMLTGESLPVTKQAGDEVYAGTLNIGRQSVEIRVTAVNQGTLLNDIVEAVRHGQMQRAPIEKYVEGFTSVFVPVVVYLALSVWIVWFAFSRSVLWSMQFAIATFVVACPCGIGLAAPTALYIGSGLAAKYGVLARGGGEAFQEAANLNVMCFDKTGTITVGGNMRITDTWGAEGDEAVQLASQLEQDTVHPLAAAVVEYAKGRRVASSRCEDIEQISEHGRGVKATITAGPFKDETALLGNEKLIENYGESKGISLTREQRLLLKNWKNEGKSVIILAVTNHGVLLMLAAADQIRPESKQVVHDLQARGVSCYMISGDNEDTARAVARKVGIDASRVIAGVLPQQKSDKIKELQQTAGSERYQYGRAIVGMIGDGVNDAPALAASDVGIAQGRGADIALSSSQFVLLREDLRGLPVLINISRAVISKVKANFFWAAIYNCVSIPIAAGVLYPWTGARLDPVWASLAMALSSISVMVNSFLLRRYKP